MRFHPLRATVLAWLVLLLAVFSLTTPSAQATDSKTSNDDLARYADQLFSQAYPANEPGAARARVVTASASGRVIVPAPLKWCLGFGLLQLLSATVSSGRDRAAVGGSSPAVAPGRKRRPRDLDHPDRRITVGRDVDKAADRLTRTQEALALEKTKKAVRQPKASVIGPPIRLASRPPRVTPMA